MKWIVRRIKRFIIQTVREELSKEGTEGSVGAIARALTRRA